MKTLLSVGALYHLFVMMIMPNLGSYLGRSAQSFVSVYASTIGLNASWNFFSPDPAHTMYIRYVIYFDSANEYSNSDNDKEPVEGTFPPEGKSGIKDLLRQRELYVMRFMVIDPKKMQMLMGPWLCKQYPEAKSVRMEHVVETVAPLEEAVTFRDESMGDLSHELGFSKTEYSCDGNMSEEEL